MNKQEILFNKWKIAIDNLSSSVGIIQNPIDNIKDYEVVEWDIAFDNKLLEVTRVQEQILNFLLNLEE